MTVTQGGEPRELKQRLKRSFSKKVLIFGRLSLHFCFLNVHLDFASYIIVNVQIHHGPCPTWSPCNALVFCVIQLRDANHGLIPIHVTHVHRLLNEVTKNNRKNVVWVNISRKFLKSEWSLALAW